MHTQGTSSKYPEHSCVPQPRGCTTFAVSSNPSTAYKLNITPLPPSKCDLNSKYEGTWNTVQHITHYVVLKVNTHFRILMDTSSSSLSSQYLLAEFMQSIYITHLRQECHNSKSVIFLEKILKVLKCSDCNDDTTALQRRVLQTALWHYSCWKRICKRFFLYQ